MPRHCLTTLSFVLATNVTLMAQTLSVEPGVLTQGQSADLKYVNPAYAGKKITITVSDGAPVNPQTATLEAIVNESGTATVTWVVPAWPIAVISAPDAGEVVVPVK